MASNLAQRLLVAVVAIPAALAVVWYGGWVLALLVAAAAWLGTSELMHFARRAGLSPATPLALLTAAALPLIAWHVSVEPVAADLLRRAWPFVAALWVLAILLLTLIRLGPGRHPLPSAAITAFGPLYAGGLPAFLLAIRHGDPTLSDAAGTALVFFPLVTVWVVDSVAMLVGKQVGGPKLAPVVSPNKTWSGTIGGFVGGLVVAPLWHALVITPLGLAVSPWQLLALAAALGILGQLGDLTESLFKREVGLKDSSHLIPGHGGVLDRLDSLYFALPLAASLYRLFGVI